MVRPCDFQPTEHDACPGGMPPPQVYQRTAKQLDGHVSKSGIPTSIKADFGRNVGTGPGEMYPDSWLTEDLPKITAAFRKATGLAQMPVVRMALAFDAGWGDKDKEVGNNLKEGRGAKWFAMHYSDDHPSHP